MISPIGLIAHKGFFKNPPKVRGTLYELPTNIDNHHIFLYSNRSESIKQAASRFLLMHQYPFAAGGRAGRFLRASFGLEFVTNFAVEAEFHYSLNHQGYLKAMRYEISQNAWTLFFEGEWHAFVNQYSGEPERLYVFPGFKAKNPRIMTFSEGKTKINNLARLCHHKPFPERFKAYFRFVATLKKRVAKKLDFD